MEASKYLCYVIQILILRRSSPVIEDSKFFKKKGTDALTTVITQMFT